MQTVIVVVAAAIGQAQIPKVYTYIHAYMGVCLSVCMHVLVFTYTELLKMHVYV